jgi:hypothetical protein
MLYFAFLQYLAVGFGVVSIILGLPLAIAFARNGDFFVQGVFRRATLGNYGPLYVEGAILSDGVVRSCIKEYASHLTYSRRNDITHLPCNCDRPNIAWRLVPLSLSSQLSIDTHSNRM